MLHKCVVCGKEVSRKGFKCPECCEIKPARKKSPHRDYGERVPRYRDSQKRRQMLKECVECGKEVSKYARKCKRCGEKYPGKEREPCKACGKGVPRYKNPCPHCQEPNPVFMYEYRPSKFYWDWKNIPDIPRIFLAICIAAHVLAISYAIISHIMSGD